MDREDEIREIAYTIWEQEGCMNGNELEYWLRAEAIWTERNTPKNSTVQKEEAPQHAVWTKSRKSRKNHK
jgi:hypothetical protein